MWAATGTHRLSSDETLAGLGIEQAEPRSRSASVRAPTRPMSPAMTRSHSPKHRLLQQAARLVAADRSDLAPAKAITSLADAAMESLRKVPSLGRLSTDCPRSDSEGDNQPPKTGLDLPLIWAAPTLPVHDKEEPEPLLPPLSHAEREVRLVPA